MINVLIPTKPDDTHALYVKLGLEAKGHRATLWYSADCPEIQKHSFRLNNGKIVWNGKGSDFDVSDHAEFDVVWLRRPGKPIMPSFIHPDDVENARSENMEFYKTLWQVIAPDAYWINPVKAITSTNCKLNQIKVAAQVGLKVPESLFSNDPEKIRAFIDSYGAGGVIYKTLYPVHWKNEHEMRLTYTKEISSDQLPSDAVLQCTPAIFQEKINKKFELRITYFGKKYIAAKLNSQEHPKGRVDWRIVPSYELLIEPYILPDEIDRKCQLFMEKLGIVFGCFDFIVTPEGEFYFLEINEQGQFLWIEDVNPEIKMLDAFVNFLIEGRGDMNAAASVRLNLADFEGKMKNAQSKAGEIHKAVGF